MVNCLHQWYTIDAKAMFFAKERPMERRRRTRNEKIFYVISILIVISMVLSMIYLAVLPN